MKYLKFLLIGIIIIIFGFLILLFIPDYSESNKYYIDVETDIKNELIEDKKIEDDVSNVTTIEMTNADNEQNDKDNEDLEKVNQNLSENFNMSGTTLPDGLWTQEEFDKNKEEFLNKMYSEYEEKYGVDYYYMDTTVVENYNTEYIDNYVKNHIVMDNLIVEPLSDYVYEYDERANLHAYKIYEVFDNAKYETVDGIAFDVETGEIFGYSTNGLRYDFDHYDYNPEWIEFCETTDWDNYGDNGTLVPFSASSVGDIIHEYVDYLKYPTKDVEHKFIWEDGYEYYKVTFHNTDNYVLIDYWNGFKYEVIDGIRYNNIKSFK